MAMKSASLSMGSPLFLQALTFTEQVTRENSRTFYLATALLPPRERRAIRVLYAFCRATDDLVDRAGATLQDVQNWRAQTSLPVEQQNHPILLAWAVTREAFDVDRRFESELITGVSMDIQRNRYATWQELEDYCYHVASTVGLLSIPIIRLAKGVDLVEAQGYAIRLGIALQLTNILRDVGEDAACGRVYFPQEDLERFGLTAADILNSVYDERFIALMKFEIARARALYVEADPGIAMLSPSARPAVAAAAYLYRAILDEIEAIQYQVYTHRAHTTAWKKLRMLPGILFSTLFPASRRSR